MVTRILKDIFITSKSIMSVPRPKMKRDAGVNALFFLSKETAFTPASLFIFGHQRMLWPLCVNFKNRLCKNVASESIWAHCDNSHAMVCKNGPSSCFCYFPGFSRVYRGKGEYTCIFSRTIWTLKNKNIIKNL